MPTRPWLPTDITSATSPDGVLEGWWFLKDATGTLANGAQYTGGGTTAAKWTDASGKGRHLFPAQGGNGGAYSANALSTGFPGITIASAAAGFRTTAGQAFPTGKAVSIFVVAAKASASGGGRCASFCVAGQFDYSANGCIPALMDASTLQYYQNFSNKSSATLANTNPNLITGYAVSNTSARMALNGTDSAAGTVAFAGLILDRFGLMSNSHAGSEGLVGTIFEAGIVSGFLSTDDVKRFQGYLAWNDGTQGSLPADHPYKAAAPTVETGGGAAVDAALAATEPQDVAAISESGAAAVTAALAATEAKDTAAVAASVSTSAALAATEAKDTAAVAASAAFAEVTGALAAAEPQDAASLSSSADTTAVLAATEAKDTAALAATAAFPGVTGTLASTEVRDTASVAGVVTIQAVLAASEPIDTAALTGGLSISAVLTATESPDRVRLVSAGPKTGGAALVLAL